MVTPQVLIDVFVPARSWRCICGIFRVCSTCIMQNWIICQLYDRYLHQWPILISTRNLGNFVTSRTLSQCTSRTKNTLRILTAIIPSILWNASYQIHKFVNALTGMYIKINKCKLNGSLAIRKYDQRRKK